MMNHPLKKHFIVRFIFVLPLIMLSCKDSEIPSLEGIINDSSISLPTRVAEPKNDYYSVVPGTVEWMQFESRDEMTRACQLEENMLSSLPTELLVEACLDYPFAYDFILVDDERFCVSDMIDSFNGLKELANRKEAVSYMINRYALLNKNNSGSAAINKSYLLSQSFIELLLCDESFLKKMTADELERFKTIAIEKYNEKVESFDYYGIYSLKHSLVVLGEIAMAGNCISDKQDLEAVNYFVRNYKTVTNETLAKISKIILNN